MANDDLGLAGERGPARTERPDRLDRLGPVADGFVHVPLSMDGGRPDTASELPGTQPDRRAGRTAARAIREVVETLLLALVIFVAVRSLVLNFRVDGNSMVPNLHDQEMLLVNRNAYFHFDLNRLLNLLPGEDRDGQRIVYPFHPPERGDIVVFSPPVHSEKPYIKRVIGLPGETVEIRQDGYVYINGKRLNEPYIQGGITECNQARCGAVRVPAGHVFVLGDNRRNSSDSRIFGPIAIDNIIGKAWLTYWPLGSFGLVPHYDYPELAELSGALV